MRLQECWEGYVHFAYGKDVNNWAWNAGSDTLTVKTMVPMDHTDQFSCPCMFLSPMFILPNKMTTNSMHKGT